MTKCIPCNSLIIGAVTDPVLLRVYGLIVLIRAQVSEEMIQTTPHSQYIRASTSPAIRLNEMGQGKAVTSL